MQLFLCPWGFLNHLRGTAGRFLLAPACALPGIREYSCWSRVMWTIESEAVAWLLPNAAGLHQPYPAPLGLLWASVPSSLGSPEPSKAGLWPPVHPFLQGSAVCCMLYHPRRLVLSMVLYPLNSRKELNTAEPTMQA